MKLKTSDLFIFIYTAVVWEVRFLSSSSSLFAPKSPPIDDVFFE